MNMVDGQVHDLTLYAGGLERPGEGRADQVIDAATGVILDSETLTNFTEGVYLQWLISGNVVITVTPLAGSSAEISGLFLDSPSTHMKSPVSAGAALIKKDATTQGNWNGTYGTQGYNVVGNVASYPAYAMIQTVGVSTEIWARPRTRWLLKMRVGLGESSPNGTPRPVSPWMST